MADRPILMRPWEVRALLDGCKTQTRRILKPQPPDAEPLEGPGWYHPTWVDRYGDEQPGPSTWGVWTPDGDWAARMPYAPGERLWVREAAIPDAPDGDDWQGEWTMWDGCGRPWRDVPDRYRRPAHVIYRADPKWSGTDLLWRSPIHMPRWASRLTLTVTDVRVQRVQDISAADCRAEGIRNWATLGTGEGFPRVGWEKDGQYFYTSEQAYEALWNTLHTKPGTTWDDNPWVAALTFTVERRNIDAEAA